MNGKNFRLLAWLLFLLTGISAFAQPSLSDLQLDTWNFNNTNWFSDSGFPPLSFTNLDNPTNWDGNALQVDSTNVAWLQYSLVESNGFGSSTTNLTFNVGSIELWVLPDWNSGTGPGDSGRLIDVGEYSTNNPSSWWSLYVNATGTSLYFSSETNGVFTNYLNYPISWNTNTWHFLALTYDSSESQLYVDGQLATNGAGVFYLPATNVTGFYVGSDVTGLAQIHGRMDDLATYNYVIGTAEITNDYGDGLLIMGTDYSNSTPPFPSGNLDSGTGMSGGAAPDYGTNLWIAQVGVVSNILTGIASNTVADVSYELQTITDLTQTNWLSTGNFILGSETTNWTPLNPLAVNLTTNLFLRLQSEQSSDASGLPNWWESDYFGTTGINPNALDSAGDGWTIYQKFAMGVNPNVFYTPAAPRAVTVSYNANTETATISWLPAPGNVTSYTVEKNYTPYVYSTPEINDFNTTATTYTNSVAMNQPDPWYNGTITVTYRVQANYTNGDSAWSAAVPLEAVTFAGSINAGAQGTPLLVVSAMPTNTTAIELTEINELEVNDENYADVYVTNITIPISDFTNGISALPNVQTASGDQSYWVGQALGANGSLSASSVVLGEAYVNTGYSYQTNWMVTPFYDGRVQLKQNLIFQLRAATVTGTLNFSIPALDDENYGPFGAFWGSYGYPTNYAYAGFYQFANSAVANIDYGTFDFDLPFEENYLFRNLVFTTADVDMNGDFTNASVAYGSVALNSPPTYGFPNEAGVSPLPNMLNTNDTSWLFYGDNSPDFDGLIGVATDYSSYYDISMPNNVQNWFGLPYVAADVVYQLYDVNTGDALGLQTDVLTAGNTLDYSLSANEDKFWSVFGDQNIYFEPAQPQFQTAEYDFWNANAVYNTGLQTWTYPILPGNPSFAPTNQSQFLLTTVGNDYFQVAGYAKLEVTNSVYSGVYGYLAQYFTNAFEMGTNGNVTTNTAGVLSPYGNFLATQPGTAALLTMPDVDTGAQGTCAVYAVSIALDANHDGKVDTSYNGADVTSANSPYVFWANNNYDRWAYDVNDNTNYMDDVLIGSNPGTSTPEPDFNYTNAAGYRAIPCTRDLEDYARLWVCGITSNLLAKLPEGSTITLNWGDVGSPNSGNPTIDVFQAADTDGGIGYLTNATVAAEQTNVFQNLYVGRLAPGGSIQLNTIQFSNYWAGNYFIWCGVSNGTGGLNMTIADANSNVLAQSTAYIQIVDIKQMYERWTVGDSPTNAPTTNAVLAADDGFPTGVPTFQYPLLQNTNTPYILFVHGWNMESWEKDRFAETAFKRLYWQGYQGRFGEFRWPTDYGFSGLWQIIATNITEKDNFDGSEYQAWQSGQGLLNKLNNLNAEYSGQVYLLAHSMGNIVASEALRLANDTQVVNTYVASQAAVSAHTYDEDTNDVPDYSFYYPPWSASADTPNIYGNWFATNNGCGAGQVISFYNVNDYALQHSVWQLDELLKPDKFVYESSTGSTNWWYYGYSGSVNGPPPWNSFYKETFFGGTVVNFDIVDDLLNRYEVMGFAAQSWTTALGATPGVHNVSPVDLTSPDNGIWPPDPTGNDYVEHFWHSGEFRGDNVQMQGYWNYLLSAQAFRLK